MPPACDRLKRSGRHFGQAQTAKPRTHLIVLNFGTWVTICPATVDFLLRRCTTLSARGPPLGGLRIRRATLGCLVPLMLPCSYVRTPSARWPPRGLALLLHFSFEVFCVDATFGDWNAIVCVSVRYCFARCESWYLLLCDVAQGAYSRIVRTGEGSLLYMNHGQRRQSCC